VTRLWRTGSRRAAPRRGASAALVGSVVLHTIAGTLVFMPPAEPSVRLPTYQVQLLAAPRPTPRQRPAPEVVERPPEPAVAEKPRPQPRPAPEPPPKPPVEAKTEPAARTNPDSLAPDVEPSTGSDAATVSVSGVQFPFPEYLRNLVAQVHRRWQPPKGNVSLRAEVFFVIHRDGAVTNFRFVTRSGNFGFDLEAQGAIEAAANAGAFGPLPDGFAADVLPVSFFFDPSTGR